MRLRRSFVIRPCLFKPFHHGRERSEYDSGWQQVIRIGSTRATPAASPPCSSGTRIPNPQLSTQSIECHGSHHLFTRARKSRRGHMPSTARATAVAAALAQQIRRQRERSRSQRGHRGLSGCLAGRPSGDQDSQGHDQKNEEKADGAIAPKKGRGSDEAYCEPHEEPGRPAHQLSSSVAASPTRRITPVITNVTPTVTRGRASGVRPMVKRPSQRSPSTRLR